MENNLIFNKRIIISRQCYVSKLCFHDYVYTCFHDDRIPVHQNMQRSQFTGAFQAWYGKDAMEQQPNTKKAAQILTDRLFIAGHLLDVKYHEQLSAWPFYIINKLILSYPFHAFLQIILNR